jgi:hypothetical protein
MVKHRNRLLVPLSSGLMKWSDQLAAFGVNTDHRQAIGGVVLNPGADIAKLSIALAGRRWISQSRLKAFQVSAKGVIHFLKQPAHSVGRNANAHTFELSGNLSGGFACHLHPLTGSPAVSYFIISAIAFMICGVFFPVKAAPHPAPEACRWRLNPRPSIPFALLQRYADPCPR